MVRVLPDLEQKKKVIPSPTASAIDGQRRIDLGCNIINNPASGMLNQSN